MSHHHRTPSLQLLLFIATVIGAIGVTPQSCAEQTQSPSKPNILFILADNWRWPNAGALGDPLAKTPTFDRLAREGMLFTHVFNPVPSCSPTRACLLTGKAAHQLGERANLWSGFPRDTPVVTTLLDQAGYQLGYSGKGWGPGNHEISGWQENPVGPRFESFTEFMQQRDASRPFFYWIGNTDTATKAGKLPYLDMANASLSEDQIQVPDVLPDVPEVRRDLMNYYGGIMKLDQMATEAITALEESGLLQQTVIVYTSDNGWQMPRGLANCYDHGSRVPLVIRWPNKVPAGQSNTAMVNVADLGPTFLDIAGLAVPAQMTMRSIVPLLEGRNQPDRDAVFMERERHADVRNDHLGYPVRAIRTREHLYLRNLRPDRWPAGDPDVLFLHGRPYGDVDTTATKDFLLDHLQDPIFADYRRWIFDKRPAEELYDLTRDPQQLTNVAERPEFAQTKASLRQRLDDWMLRTGDPRCNADDDQFDRYPYYGKAPR